MIIKKITHRVLNVLSIAVFVGICYSTSLLSQDHGWKKTFLYVENIINHKKVLTPIEGDVIKNVSSFFEEISRAQFRNMVEPFLRDVKGRRGITDFKVVCDRTNNTSAIIDANKFVADIYVKPARSINYITLNFIATRTGVEFSEIAGGN